MNTNVAKPAKVAIIGASGAYGKGILARAEEISVEAVPALFDLDASALPTEIEATYQFLLGHEWTRCKLDDGAAGIPEGVVVRSPDRRSTAKIRREELFQTDDNQIVGNDRDRTGDHIGRQIEREYQVFTREMHPREGVSCQRASNEHTSYR